MTNMLQDKFTPEYYLRVGITAIGSCSTFGAVIFAGQSIETEVRVNKKSKVIVSQLLQFDVTLSAINKVAWYNFNHSNKRSYLIFLLNMMQPWKLKFSENYSVNYELGRAVCFWFLSECILKDLVLDCSRNLLDYIRCC